MNLIFSILLQLEVWGTTDAYRPMKDSNFEGLSIRRAVRNPNVSENQYTFDTFQWKVLVESANNPANVEDMDPGERQDVCADDWNYDYFSEFNGCDWVDGDRKERCPENKSICPRTCAKCPCQDNLFSQFKIRKKKRDCAWVRKGNSKKRCRFRKAAKKCKKTCNEECGIY